MYCACWVSGVSVWTVFRGVIPFLIADFFQIALLVAVPSLRYSYLT